MGFFFSAGCSQWMQAILDKLDHWTGLCNFLLPFFFTRFLIYRVVLYIAFFCFRLTGSGNKILHLCVCEIVVVITEMFP